MSTAYVLGAGFSYAATGLPLTDEVGNRLLRRLPTAVGRVPESFAGGTFETWMSRISEPQPDLSEVENARNAAMFVEVTHGLHEVLTQAENKALTKPAPEWLIALVRIMHVQQATVATFNYDTILERAALSSDSIDDEGQRRLTEESLYRDLPPVLLRPYGLVSAAADTSTFTLLKLHGSLNWYWTRGDNSGATLGRAFAVGGWRPNGAHVKPHTARAAPGREPFLVPPASAKSAYYQNPVTRQLWRNTAHALREADRVVIAGYSLPVTDLVTVGMLSDALAGRDCRVEVVNPDAGRVADRLAGLGINREHITCHDGEECLSEYTQSLAEAMSAEALSRLSTLEASSQLLVRSGSGFQPIMSIDTDGDTVMLTPADAKLHFGTSVPLGVGDCCQAPACTVQDLLKQAGNRSILEVAHDPTTRSPVIRATTQDNLDGPWVILDLASTTRPGQHPDAAD